MSSYLAINKVGRLSDNPYSEQILELIFSGVTHLPIPHLKQFLNISILSIGIDEKVFHQALQVMNILFLIKTLDGKEIFKLHTKGIMMDCCCLVVEKVILFTLPCNKSIN